MKKRKNQTREDGLSEWQVVFVFLGGDFQCLGSCWIGSFFVFVEGNGGRAVVMVVVVLVVTIIVLIVVIFVFVSGLFFLFFVNGSGGYGAGASVGAILVVGAVLVGAVVVLVLILLSIMKSRRGKMMVIGGARVVHHVVTAWCLMGRVVVVVGTRLVGVVHPHVMRMMTVEIQMVGMVMTIHMVGRRLLIVVVFVVSCSKESRRPPLR